MPAPPRPKQERSSAQEPIPINYLFIPSLSAHLQPLSSQLQPPGVPGLRWDVMDSIDRCEVSDAVLRKLSEVGWRPCVRAVEALNE